MCAGYMSFIFASSSLPGVPVWQTPPEVINEVLLSSINFFYINSGLNALGLSFIPDIPVRSAATFYFHFFTVSPMTTTMPFPIASGCKNSGMADAWSVACFMHELIHFGLICMI